MSKNKKTNNAKLNTNTDNSELSADDILINVDSSSIKQSFREVPSTTEITAKIIKTTKQNEKNTTKENEIAKKTL